MNSKLRLQSNLLISGLSEISVNRYIKQNVKMVRTDFPILSL